MSSVPGKPDSGQAIEAKSLGGLPLLDRSRWSDFQNPVLRCMGQVSGPQPDDTLNIVTIPCPQVLQFDLNYRGTALQACVTPGQRLESGDPLTQKQFDSHSNQLLPAILCPLSAVVESVDHSACKRYTRVNLSVTECSQHSSLPCIDQPGALPWYCNQWQKSNREQRWQAVRDAGIRGHGGGGFPLADKANRTIETIIINAVECEPLISCDAALMRHHAHEVLQGIVSIVEMSECLNCIVAFESGDEWQVKLLQQAISELRQQYEKSASQKYLYDLCDRLSITVVPAIYPQGAERILIKTVTGKTLDQQELPIDQQICCTNIGTCYALYQLAHTGHPPSERIVTLTGDAMVNSAWGAPVNVLTTYGTPLGFLLQTAELDADSVRLQIGGPVCGQELDSSDYSVDAATNCIVISHSEAVEQSDNCIRCGNCVEVCPASLLPQQLHFAVSSNKPQLAQTFNLSSCLECGCCDLVCPSNIPLTRQFRQARRVANDEKAKTSNAALALQRYENRLSRLEQREAARSEQRQQRKRSSDDKAIKKQAIAEALARARKKTED